MGFVMLSLYPRGVLVKHGEKDGARVGYARARRLCTLPTVMRTFAVNLLQAQPIYQQNVLLAHCA